jgi:hypothetical protein
MTGWACYVTNRYVSLSQLTCPSQGWKPQLGTWSYGLHYSYRYNSSRTLCYGTAQFTGNMTAVAPPGFLSDPTRSWRALFSDAALGRRYDSGVQAHQIVTVNPPSWPYYYGKWAHMDGGNVMTHMGNAVWVNNIAPVAGAENTTGPGFPRQWYVNNSSWDKSIDSYLLTH